MASNFRQQQFIGQVRAANRKAWEGIRELKALQPEAVSLDYGSTLADGDNEHTGITNAEIIAVLFTSADAIDAFMAANGHATNMAKLL